MERLKRRIELAQRTWATLAELTAIERPSLVERDAPIQRFE